MARQGPPRIAIIGAGPVGIEAALYAKRLGYPTIVYERGEVGEHLSRWGHVRLFSPFGLNHTPLGIEAVRQEHPQHDLPGPTDIITGREHRDAYLMPLALTSTLVDCIRMKTEVLHIGRSNVFRSDPAADPRRAAAAFRILARDDKQRETMDEADVVLDCSGTYAQHRWLGPGGIPAFGERAAEKQIAYGLEDILKRARAYYAGKSVIVVGGGYSAATSVCALATLAEQNSSAWIIWLNRGGRSMPLPRASADPLRERDRLAARANQLATRGEGNVEYKSITSIESVESHGPDQGFRVAARYGNEELTWEVERVIANVGFNADLNLCRELHVLEPDDRHGVVQPEPNYFVLGAKSTRFDGDFLLRAGFEQVRDVFARIAAKPKLDLYGGKLQAPARLSA